LEKSQQRPVPGTRAQGAKLPEIAGQRPAPANLTCGNADDYKTIVARWFEKFWGNLADLSVVDELAAQCMIPFAASMP
jgi:hypothetical protein